MLAVHYHTDFKILHCGSGYLKPVAGGAPPLPTSSRSKC